MAVNRSDNDAGAALREIVENSRVIADTASDAIITIDESSTILFVNRAATKIFGYSSEELMGSDLTMLMPEYLRHVHRAGLTDYIETGQKHISWQAVELPGLHKSGRELALELSFGESHKDGHRFFTGIARDITQRKRDAERLKLQTSVTEILSRCTSLTDAASELLAAMCTTLGWQFGSFWLAQSTPDQLHSIAHWPDNSSPEIAQFAEASGRFTASDQSFPARIWTQREPLWVADFGVDESFPRSAVAVRGNLHSAFGFPIVSSQSVLGVIELFSSKVEKPDTAMLSSLTAIGSQIGQFIERLKAEEGRREVLSRAQEARREAEQLTAQLSALQTVTDAALGHLSLDELMSESLSRIREVLHVDTVAILLLRQEADELIAWAAQGLEEEVALGVRIPVGRGFAGRVVQHGQPVIISEVENADLFNPILREKGIKSLLGVPLIVEGRPIGVLHVGTFVHTDFTKDDVRLLQSAADRIALAIENARLYQVEHLARAEAESANRAKDEFLTILSHELRTPLTPIIGWVHMMENGMLPETEFEKGLSIINRNAYDLKRLINDLLDMSAILSGKMRMEENSVELAALLTDAVDTMRSFAADSGVEINLEILENARAFTLKGDRNRLKQTFCNLLHNAIKFSPPQTTVHVSAEATGSETIITVQDQGEGIPAEFLPHVFERFRQADGSRTRSYGGLGLGLSLVQSFVKAHGGNITVSSEGRGRGSKFTIRLPEDSAAGLVSSTEIRPAAPAGEDAYRILLVEDQIDTLEMLAASFQAFGFQTIDCESAVTALDCINREKFDILISDIAMPDMDGLQLIR
ncbi:MAG TPA: GAF domain-containing protein, partial [Pyrinomonadaceae bacterium]|nr:GAF domain-containing protein [Pyrinomonadaceae bacterium]